MRDAADSNAGEAMTEIIDEFTETPRSPRGDVAAFKPAFTFTPPTESMGPAVKNVLLEIQKWDLKKLAWKKYMLVKLASDATSWTPTKPIPMNDYRWRTGYVRGAGTFTLPSGETQKIKAATLMEPNYTEFARTEVEAGDPTQLSPSASFTADATEKTYSFSTVAGADKYGLAVSFYDTKKESMKLWKKLVITPTAEDVNAAVVEVTIKGHKVDTYYEWSVQSLNYDNPKPVWPDWSID
jgi:hypothetical protein